MGWKRMFKKAMWIAFAAVFVICVVGCTATGSGSAYNGVDEEGIQFVKKGEPSPDDGFWLSRPTFLMLYEAAEKSATLQSSASPLIRDEATERKATME